MKKISVKLGSSEFEVLHLKNLFELTLGLMFRKKGNALMEFKKEGKYGIWMFLMRYHLDLIFLDKNRKVVDLIKNVPPLSFNPKTWEIYYPKENYKYLLELDSRKKIEVKIKDILSF